MDSEPEGEFPGASCASPGEGADTCASPSDVRRNAAEVDGVEDTCATDV